MDYERSRKMRKLLILPLAAALLLGAPSLAYAGWEEGVAAFKAKNYAEAARQFQSVTEEHPDWPNGYFMLGQVLGKLDRNQEALAALRKAYDLNPNEVAYQLQLGTSYLQNNRYRDAAQLLQKIDESQLSGQQAQVYHKALAVALDKTGQSGAALGALARAAQSNPNDAAAQYNYGAAAFNAGRTADAVKALEKAVNLDGQDVKKRRAYLDALMRQGRETTGSGKAGIYRKAAEAGKALVARNPSYDNLLKLGEAQLGAAQYSEAIQSFNQAAAKNSQEWIPYFYMGQASTAKKDYTRAETELKQALTKNVGKAEQDKVYKQLAFVYEKQKNYDAAIEAYTKAGDTSGATRARENADIAKHNQEAEAEQQEYQELKAKEAELQKQLQELGAAGGAPPPPSN